MTSRSGSHKAWFRTRKRHSPLRSSGVLLTRLAAPAGVEGSRRGHAAVPLRGESGLGPTDLRPAACCARRQKSVVFAPNARGFCSSTLMCISILWSHYIYITMHFYLASFIGNHIYIHFVALYSITLRCIIYHSQTFGRSSLKLHSA